MDSGSPVNKMIGKLNANDEDHGETFTFFLANGTGDLDNHLF